MPCGERLVSRACQPLVGTRTSPIMISLGGAPGARSIQALKVFLSRTAMKCALKTPRRLPGLTCHAIPAGQHRPAMPDLAPLTAACRPAVNRPRTGQIVLAQEIPTRWGPAHVRGAGD